MSEILARPVFEKKTPGETSRQADCTNKVAWNLARKYASLSRTLNNVLFSCEGARDIEDCIGELQCTTLSKEN